MPDVTAKNVEKTQWRQNRTLQSFLTFNVVLNNERVSGETQLIELRHVLGVQPFIEPDLVERRGGVNCGDQRQRRSVSKQTWRKAQKDSYRQNDREQD